MKDGKVDILESGRLAPAIMNAVYVVGCSASGRSLDPSRWYEAEKELMRALHEWAEEIARAARHGR